jgi:hypothetical protein
LTEADIESAIGEALAHPLEPLQDTAVPDTLLTADQMRVKTRAFPPAFVPLKSLKSDAAGSGGASISSSGVSGLFGLRGARTVGGDSGNALGVVQRELSNGMRVSLKTFDAEPQKVSMRLFVPGENTSQPRGAIFSLRFLLQSRSESYSRFPPRRATVRVKK